jgi:hypothetical protein
VAVEKGSFENQGNGQEKNYVPVPAKFSVWKMQSGLPVPNWNKDPKKPKLPFFDHNNKQCPPPESQEERENAKCSFIGVDH